MLAASICLVPSQATNNQSLGSPVQTYKKPSGKYMENMTWNLKPETNITITPETWCLWNFQRLSNFPFGPTRWAIFSGANLRVSDTWGGDPPSSVQEQLTDVYQVPRFVRNIHGFCGLDVSTCVKPLRNMMPSCLKPRLQLLGFFLCWNAEFE